MITSLKKVSESLNLDLDDITGKVFNDFPLQIPKSFLSRIKPNDRKDPLLLQILPTEYENKNVTGFNKDPLQENKYSPISGLIHKHQDRVLLLVTDHCAINCRFCFRRYFREKLSDWEKVFSYIESNILINEVVLSGGDPLMLTSKKLREILDRLNSIDHIARIRIHSRLPIVMPDRIDSKLLQNKKPIILVVHCNHPNEINKEVAKKLKLLKKKNITIFNQSVLLRNINDSADILISLSEKLFACGVLPYYLHMLDKVKGSAHFYVNLDRAKKIYHIMKARLPGYLVPKLVLETKKEKKYV